jgi:hypothetical protein
VEFHFVPFHFHLLLAMEIDCPCELEANQNGFACDLRVETEI